MFVSIMSAFTIKVNVSKIYLTILSLLGVTACSLNENLLHSVAFERPFTNKGYLRFIYADMNLNSKKL
jgi:hypothetical protein